MASRTSGDLVIETSSLRKEFTGRGGTRVVDLDLAVPRGGVHGLGPNGSGKTTTIRMLLCLARLTGAIVGAAVLALFWGGAWDVGSSRDITAPGELVLAVVVVVAIVLSPWSIQRRDVP